MCCLFTQLSVVSVMGAIYVASTYYVMCVIYSVTSMLIDAKVLDDLSLYLPYHILVVDSARCFKFVLTSLIVRIDVMIDYSNVLFNYTIECCFCYGINVYYVMCNMAVTLNKFGNHCEKIICSLNTKVLDDLSLHLPYHIHVVDST